MAFSGFLRNVRFTPVPSPLFGPLLEQIDDIGELKCTLRIIWLLHQKKGFPRYVTHSELLADRVLAKALAGEGDARSEITRAVALATQRGTLLSAPFERGDARGQAYTLNTDGDRRALTDMLGREPPATAIPEAEPWEGAPQRPNIFGLYEDNIGMLSPMIAEELKEAEETYPQSWIEDAFREAVAQNKRSWRYIAAILDRWHQEGRTDGESGRYPKKAGQQQQYLRR
jgi:DnaD/phage-associated family protein